MAHRTRDWFDAVMLNPRRRIRDRLLIGMVAVALLPLATFAVLAAIDLDAIGKSTAEAAQGAILQDEQRRQQANVSDGAGLIDTVLVGINSDLLRLRDTAATALARTPAHAGLPGGLTASGTACYTGGAGRSAAVLACNPTPAAARLYAATAQLVGQMQALRNDYPEVQSVWVANQQGTALRVVPAFNMQSALLAGRVDPVDPGANYRADVFAASSGRYRQHAPGWTDPQTQTGWESGPYWTDPYPLVSTGATGVSGWQALPDGQTLVGVDLTVPGLITGALAPTAASPLPPGSYPLLLSSDGTVLYAGAQSGLDFDVTGDLSGSPLPIPPSSGLAASLKAIEGGSHARAGPLVATLGGVTKDIFTAPIYAGRWVLARPVPLSYLQPDLVGLTAGVTSGVHHLFPLVVLPALVLLLVLAFLAATLVSRRMVGPVRHLTVAADRLARGETDVPVPPQGQDELGVLAGALERMRRDINSSRDAILGASAELEGRVALRTRELRMRNDELVALNDLAGSLTRSLEPHVILTDALQAFRVIHPLIAGRGYVLDDETLLPAAATPETSDVGDDPELDAIAAETVHRRAPARRAGSGASLLGWPLVTRQGVVGAVAIRTEAAPAPDTRRLLQAVADQVALALRTSQLSATGREHAVLEERTRLAREIHDTLAQQLTAIVIQLEAADTLVERGSAQARRSVETARELARAALQEARRSVWNLRPAPLAATGLVAALEREVGAWESRSGIRARFKARSVPSRPNLQPPAEVALLRTLQEALANVANHSRAASVRVTLRAERDEIVLSVHDDGIGFQAGAEPPRPDCFGLEGMRQRVRHAGGALAVVSRPGHGTEITARVPLAEQPAVAHTA